MNNCVTFLRSWHRRLSHLTNNLLFLNNVAHWQHPDFNLTLSVFGVGQLVAWPIGEASRAEPKFCLWFLWRNGNELRGLRAKFWRGPSYHAKRCLQGYQHVILSSIVRLRAFLWHNTVLPPSRGSIRCIIAEKHWQCHFSRKPEVKIWRKHAQSTFRTRLPIRLLYQ